MKRIERKEWLEDGMKILKKEGFQRITIDNLCKSLKITKGSFYHHFKNMEDYIEALMKYWQNKNTLEFIKKTEEQCDIQRKYFILSDLASSTSHKVEQIIRAWSFSNETVKAYVKQVDHMRIEYLTDLNIQQGLDLKKARNSAIMQYGTLIGIQQLLPDIPKVEFNELYQTHCKTNIDNE
ncbi:MAG: TetR/AcrR family transcriptional regulator [Sphingobacterium sp.]|jgi:AcrR family transcriptional regulator|nr:TetR/AcrR family transcriptional regulator [Sphingobacterium sp.]